MSLLDSMPHRCRIQRRTKVNDAISGATFSKIVEQTNIQCWEQPLSVTDILKYGKMGMSVNTKVYFIADPRVTDRNEIVITERQGTPVPVAQQKTLRDITSYAPDKSAGAGVLWMVVGNYIPGSLT